MKQYSEEYIRSLYGRSGIVNIRFTFKTLEEYGLETARNMKSAETTCGGSGLRWFHATENNSIRSDMILDIGEVIDGYIDSSTDEDMIKCDRYGTLPGKSMQLGLELINIVEIEEIEEIAGEEANG